MLGAWLLGVAAVDLTVYHVNPLHEGVIPVDMDTADLRGDIFFDLRSKTLPVECASDRAIGSDCANEEVVDDDLVITKLKWCFLASIVQPSCRVKFFQQFQDTRVLCEERLSELFSLQE